MDSEDMFWLRFWQLAAGVVVALIIGISSVSIHRDYQIAQGLAQGLDATKLSCVYATSSNTSIICAIQAAKDQE